MVAWIIQLVWNRLEENVNYLASTNKFGSGIHYESPKKIIPRETECQIWENYPTKMTPAQAPMLNCIC